MIENFAEALRLTLVHEGGFVHDPRDPGGATNHGITQGTYDRFRDRNDDHRRTVAEIETEEVEAIYRHEYWNAVQGDDLPAGVDFAVFDAAVMSGPRRALQWLDAHRGDDPVEVIKYVCAERIAFCRQLSTWGHFGEGWTKRIAGVEREALAMLA